MRDKISSKIFIDGGVVAETAEAKEFLGYLDGQTTNPTLIAKNLEARSKNQELSKKISREEALNEYKRIVQEISQIIPQGSISIQVFANKETKAEEMIEQARVRKTWITNGSIKVPCTFEGLSAAEVLCKEMPINITLNFSQSQAAAVYEATKGAKFPVFISPFVGRLDDIGENGMQVVENILKMYSSGDGHVETLTASVRSIEHILYAISLKSPIITIPFKTFKEWASGGFQTPQENYKYFPHDLKPIPYDESIILGKDWKSYDLAHPLTDKGLQRFWDDWMGIVG